MRMTFLANRVMRLWLPIALLLSGCATTPERTFTHNITPLERAMIAAIEQEGPGERYVINKVNVAEKEVDRFSISLTLGTPYTAASESGSATVGAGSVVQICGWGEFLGLNIFTEYPYLCRPGEGLVFGVTQHGWVHLYGTGEIDGVRISITKPG